MTQNPAEKLCAFVIARYGRRLSATQLRGPWTYIGSRTGEISGLVIDPDGEHAGFRVMLADMDAPQYDGAPELELT